MGLPGSILAAEQKKGFPEEVHVKVLKIQEIGGMKRLEEIKKTLDELSTETAKLCNEIISVLEEEEKDDLQCRQQFQTRWTRLPSAQLTVNMKKQLKDYISKVELAQKSDSLINQKIQDNLEKLKRLETNRQDLDKLMPNPDMSGENPLGKSYNDLKQYLGELDQMFGKEEQIEHACRQYQESERYYFFI